MPKRETKTARFAGIKVTEDFLSKTKELIDRHKLDSDTELVETAIDFLNLAGDEKFRDMKVSDFLDVFLTIKKG